jgi:phage-related protein
LLPTLLNLSASRQRRLLSRQLGQIQAGLEPDRWKPFDDVGAGTKEIIINLDDGWFRVMYVATARYRSVIQERTRK